MIFSKKYLQQKTLRMEILTNALLMEKKLIVCNDQCTGTKDVFQSYWVAKASTNCLSCIFNEVGTYSGSRYPGVPTTAVDTWVSDSKGMILDIPKSPTLACSFSFSKMFAVLTSLWIMGGLQPLCKYSSATNSISNSC